MAEFALGRQACLRGPPLSEGNLCKFCDRFFFGPEESRTLGHHHPFNGFFEFNTAHRCISPDDGARPLLVPPFQHGSGASFRQFRCLKSRAGFGKIPKLSSKFIGERGQRGWAREPRTARPASFLNQASGKFSKIAHAATLSAAELISDQPTW